MMNETKRLAYVNYEKHARVELENKGNLGTNYTYCKVCKFADYR